MSIRMSSRPVPSISFPPWAASPTPSAARRSTPTRASSTPRIVRFRALRCGRRSGRHLVCGRRLGQPARRLHGVRRLARATPRLVRRRLDREERKYVRHEETGACRRPFAMIAAAATAAQPGHLADRHAARSVDCAACHAVKTPAEGAGSRHAEVPCLPRLAQRRLRKDPRPRQRPVARPAREPQPRPQLRAKATKVGQQCSRCHLFEYKVP